MFGYVKPYVPELRVRDNEYYRAVYCGLCRSLGKCTGTLSRITLSYDLVFAALLRFAATGAVPQISTRRCVAHPIKRRAMADPCDELDFCARSGILLSFHKLEDDVSDERGSKRARAKFLKSVMRGMSRRAKRTLAEADRIISDGLLELSKAEKSEQASVDVPADIFGNMLGEVFCLGLEGSSLRILKKAGYHMGRWLYIIDAADDYEDDIEKERFNPFAILYEKQPFDETKKETVFNALSAELMEIYAAFELLDPQEGQGEIFAVTDNILRLGMPHAAAVALDFKKYEQNKEISDD